MAELPVSGELVDGWDGLVFLNLLLFFFSCALLNFPFDKDILEMGRRYFP